MSRPLMQLGVGELETLFARSKSDIKALKQLEHELQHRQVPRAVALLAEVQAARSEATPATPAGTSTSPSPAPQQSGIGERLPPIVPTRVVAPISTPRPPASAIASDPPAGAIVPPPVAPIMSLEDANKTLKATAGSTWESIELTRRHLVQQSSPLTTCSMSHDRRALLLSEAKRVNSAYEVLSKHRTRNQ